MTKRIVLLFIVLSLLPVTVLFALRLLWCTFFTIDRAWLIVLSYDDLWNVVSNGYIGQTISYRSATAKQQGKRWGCILCHWLDEVQLGHCDKALLDRNQNLK